ncbi:hypothetical protein KSD_17320 [Ktedonobacter sp. SOSP1-85]|uniref:BREX-1 system phosphatase PglZ type B n=1 Tax=Ktedonobacter sp. SOSP1-85 TaxID=2778367 RepID=UPI0019158199|nr:BREX-1 system phosphatase PglZ type B [Ktedonobacter sp. SOSP1-85]GHO73961.1 hypothetical protein KSD_17320 [Ktedonobacter sp. SOSP1-85]
MSEQITFLDTLVDAIKRAGNYNKNDQEPPVAVLWTDKERQWEPLLPLLRVHLPLLTFGAYDPALWTGPAYWLRCVIARTLPEYQFPLLEGTPIIYLPSISRQELRASEETPKELQPLAELQYRGVAWTQQKSGRDWTITTFLSSLGVEIAGDAATRTALRRALLKFAGESIARLQKDAPLRAAFFDALLNPDEARNLLLWLNDPAGYPTRCSEAEWASFCDLCAHKYGFHPAKDGAVSAAGLLGEHQGAWDIVWKRFSEAPHAYPNLPDLLRRARPKQLTLFSSRESWPQDNEEAEQNLREKLLGQRDRLPQEVHATLLDLEKEHAPRRMWVWSALGRSSLVNALRYLMVLARETERAFGGTTVAEIRAAYTEWGWKVDEAVIDALASVEHTEDAAAVKSVITAVYRPWLENAATVLQKAVYAGPLGQTYPVASLPEPEAGTCMLFSDGLRYDVGQRLVAGLTAQSLTCTVGSHLVPLPGITSTAKPAISPVAHLLTGNISAGLAPVVASSGTKVTVDVLRRLLEQTGYQVLRGEGDLGDPAGRAWTEMGNIDSHGHQNEWRLAHHLKGEVTALERRIAALLDWGWKRVVVVTDHGWLLLPGTLPKAELPEHLTHVRKGRCAQLKETANSNQETVPWHWNSDIRIALAPNIRCYEAGKEYEHGGVSPQECFVPVITVSQPKGAHSQPVTIENVTWKGLRCKMHVTGLTPGMKVDMRTKAGDTTTSLIGSLTVPGADGSVSLLVEDDDRMGEPVLIVVLNSDGTVSKQISTIVGD